MERIDLKNDFKKNKEFLDIAFKPGTDHGIGWHCSLRQHEHDNEYDGMLDLYDPHDSYGKNRILQHSGSTDFDNNEDSMMIMSSNLAGS